MHLLDLNGPAHVFYEAREHGAEVELCFASMGNDVTIESSVGLGFSNLKPYREVPLSEGDFVFVPGLEYKLLSSSDFLEENQPFFDWLHIQHRARVNICSVCTGVFLLAESGVLNGKECTTHWRYRSKLSERFPDIEVKSNQLFTANDNLYTSAGVASGIDLALYIIEEQFGSRFATDIAKEVVIYFRRSESDPQLSAFLQHRNHLETRIHDAQDYIAERLSTDFTIQDIAETVNMSPRNLTRLFKRTTGITIGNYTEKLKADRAVQLLSEKNKVESVAKECGLSSANQLRRILKKHKGVLPSDISALH